MRDSVLPIPRQAAKMGWGRFAGTGDKALAGNRVTAGKAAIGARHIAIVAAFQIDFEVLTEWGTQLVPRRLEVTRLHLRHSLSPVACWSVRLGRAKYIYASDSGTAHERIRVGNVGIEVAVLALLASDLVALTMRARGAFHDSSCWTSRTDIASLLIWAVEVGAELLRAQQETHGASPSGRGGNSKIPKI